LYLLNTVSKETRWEVHYCMSFSPRCLQTVLSKSGCEWYELQHVFWNP